MGATAARICAQNFLQLFVFSIAPRFLDDYFFKKYLVRTRYLVRLLDDLEFVSKIKNKRVCCTCWLYLLVLGATLDIVHASTTDYLIIITSE